MDQNILELAGLILNCKAEDLRGSFQRADGSLAVIAPNGMKFIFSPVELDNARDSFGLPPFQTCASTLAVKQISTSKTRRHGAPRRVAQ